MRASTRVSESVMCPARSGGLEVPDDRNPSGAPEWGYGIGRTGSSPASKVNCPKSPSWSWVEPLR